MMSKPEWMEKLRRVSDICGKVMETISEYESGEASMIEACRRNGFDYFRFRRYCAYIAGLDSERFVPHFIDAYQCVSDVEVFYMDVFGLSPDDVGQFMPEDAEKAVEAALGTLTDREKTAVEMKYFKGATLQEIGNQFGLSRERARQILAAGIRKLRRPGSRHILQYGPKLIGEVETEREKELQRRREEYRRILSGMEYNRKNEQETKEEKNPEDPKPAAGIAEDGEDVAAKVFVCDMPISVRSKNALSRQGVRTLRDILGYNTKEVSRFRNLGAKCLQEIREAVQNYGYQLKDE